MSELKFSSKFRHLGDGGPLASARELIITTAVEWGYQGVDRRGLCCGPLHLQQLHADAALVFMYFQSKTTFPRGLFPAGF